MSNPVSLLRLPATLAASGHRRSTFYAGIKRGEIPPPVKIGERAAAWPAHEIEAVNRARMAGAGSTELRALVARLLKERAECAKRRA